MNKLEDQNVHEFRIRKTILVLIAKGGGAWLCFALVSYGYELLFRTFQNETGPEILYTLLNTERVINTAPTFHLVLNILFGWLMLYIVLTWIYQYFLIKEDTLVVRKGILFSTETVYQMDDIKSVTVDQGFFSKLFNVGTLRLHAFRAQKKFALPDVRDPHTVAAHIQELIPKIAPPFSLDTTHVYP